VKNASFDFAIMLFTLVSDSVFFTFLVALGRGWRLSRTRLSREDNRAVVMVLVANGIMYIAGESFGTSVLDSWTLLSYGMLHAVRSMIFVYVSFSFFSQDKLHQLNVISGGRSGRYVPHLHRLRIIQILRHLCSFCGVAEIAVLVTSAVVPSMDDGWLDDVISCSTIFLLQSAIAIGMTPAVFACQHSVLWDNLPLPPLGMPARRWSLFGRRSRRVGVEGLNGDEGSGRQNNDGHSLAPRPPKTVYVVVHPDRNDSVNIGSLREEAASVEGDEVCSVSEEAIVRVERMSGESRS